MERTIRSLALVAASLYLIVLTACDPAGRGENSSTDDQGETAAQSTEQAERSLPPATASLRASINQAIEANGALDGSQGRFLETIVRQQGDFARLLKSAYESRSGAAFFHVGEGANEDRRAMLALLQRLPDEALAPEPYALERIAELVRREGDLQKTIDETKRCERYADTQRTLCEIVMASTETPSEEQTGEALQDAGLAELDLRVVAFVDDAIAEHVESRAALIEVQSELDVLLLRGFFQYVADFALIRRAHPDEQSEHPEEVATRQRVKLLEHLELAQGQLATHLRSLRPVSPMYERTVAALVRYQEIAAEGGFDKLTLKYTRRGKKGPEVLALKKRLTHEGYFGGDIDDRYDDSLVDAVKGYQRRHALKVDGKALRPLYKSLNISIEKRVRSLELSLQRWRESHIRPGLPLYARVNIPQFEVEFWEGDKLARTHRVIVGSNAVDRNLQDGVEGRLNHTRLFDAEISSVVLNPTWSVPIRITKYELDRELMENPQYYEENNFEITELASGRRLVKQGPGPNNALGEVKFIFPNPHAIYMHDTPKRHLFQRVYRAFSHGCIRTHKPIELARWLLERQNGMPASDVNRLLKRRKERSVRLDDTVPIFIEYNTVSVDADGLVSFFDDVYRYDRAFWAGKLPFERSREIDEERLAALQEEEANWQAELKAKLEDSDIPPDEATLDGEAGTTE